MDFTHLVARYGRKDFIVNSINKKTQFKEVITDVYGVLIPAKSKTLNKLGQVDEYSATFMTNAVLDSVVNKLELIDKKGTRYIMTPEYEIFDNENSSAVKKVNHASYKLAIIGN